ncbi:tRNA lysidine(34) synthetase TilS [Buchnera aphidicola]|uniref:tRNA lysidine(34) synthetase TilS n=1 Tax=Buchnera aphidicola TaxID=9 RepID=UPI0034640C91
MIKINKKILKYKKFLLAYSGGIDSTVLLYKLLKYKKKKKISIRAIHINHQIHPKSKLWSEHCKKICKKNNVPIIIKKISIKKKNIESNARKKRYKIFQKNLLPQEILLTGHNLDDQCETLLLSIKRGSGLKGLSGISYKKKIFKNYLFRPLLKVSRKKIEKWAISQNLQWIEDTSNYDISYDRNFLRHKIIPQINQRWKFFKKNCLKVSQIIYKEYQLLNKFISSIFKKNLYQKNILNIKKIQNMNPNIQYFILKKWIYLNIKKNLSYSFLTEIIKNILHKKKKNPRIKLKKYEIWNYNEHLYLIKKTPKMKDFIIFWHYPYNKLKLPKKFGYLKIKNQKNIKNSSYIRAPKNQQMIKIKFHTNKKIKINKKNPKTLKKIFNELQIPPWKRKKIPLLFYNNKFISAIGFFVTTKKYNINEKKISVIWKKNI